LSLPLTRLTTHERPSRHPGTRLLAARHGAPPQGYPADWLALARQLAADLAPGAVTRDTLGTLPLEEVRALRESGIVNLLYPAALGGGGGTLREAAWSVLEIARADASVGAILGFHYYNSLVPLLLDYDGRNDDVVRESVEQRWQWGNVTQYVNGDFVAERAPEGGYTITGTKKWNTGTPIAEHTTLLLIHPDRTHFIYAHIPTDRAGLTFHEDWDQIGLRGADSSTISFDKVRVAEDEVLHWGHEGYQTGPLPLWATFGAVFYAAVYLGSTLAALDAARTFATAGRRQSVLPGATTTAEDVLVQTQYADLWLKARAAEALFESTIAKLADGWERRKALSEDDRGLLAVETLALRTYTSQVALEVTAQVFEFGGGRATNRAHGFDRFWRNVRTLANHDPLVLAQRTLGNFALTGKPPRFPSSSSRRPRHDTAQRYHRPAQPLVLALLGRDPGATGRRAPHRHRPRRQPRHSPRGPRIKRPALCAGRSLVRH
jgi:alkylation response protein AidB-like acyl-CoA dehydrogenase